MEGFVIHTYVPPSDRFSFYKHFPSAVFLCGTGFSFFLSKKMPNKRKAKSTTDNNKNKQRSIVNFFNHVKKECTTAEKIEDEPVDIEHSKVETSIVESSKVEPTLVEPTTETTDEPPFFTNSMYTDEVNLMLETVLSGEQFLFDQEENRTFESFRSLAGFFLLFFFLFQLRDLTHFYFSFIRRTETPYCSFVNEKSRLDQKRQVKVSNSY